jgi:hypothetical protein
VENMEGMFYGARSFENNLSNWKISPTIQFEELFCPNF